MSREDLAGRTRGALTRGVPELPTPLDIVIDWFQMSINFGFLFLVTAGISAAFGKRRLAVISLTNGAVIFFGILLHHWDVI